MRRFRALAVVALVALAGQAAVGTYRVVRGDTLSGIARKHRTTPAEIAKTNGIANPNRIREGQVLSLGGPPPVAIETTRAAASTHVVVGGSGQRTHVVRRGETLARIAARYRTTPAEIAKANGIANPNRIREGATLVVPGAAEPWLCPVEGRSWFSDSWGAPRPGGRRHRGTDLFAFRGTPVRAPVGGTLTHGIGKVAGNAWYLVGDDGHRYYGAHLDKLDAGPGRIERGARIGTVGSTGNAEGLTPHLHLEIHLRGPHGFEPINPIPTVERWCR